MTTKQDIIAGIGLAGLVGLTMGHTYPTPSYEPRMESDEHKRHREKRKKQRQIQRKSRKVNRP